MQMGSLRLYISVILLGTLLGCSAAKGNIGQMPTYLIPDKEAGWIRDGQPVVFEEELWYPQDSAEILLDSEVYLLGEFNGVNFFVDKLDVRPYNRLYTKVGRNKFRVFKKSIDTH